MVKLNQVLYALRVLAKENHRQLQLLKENEKQLQKEADKYGYRIDEKGELIKNR